MTGSSQAGSDTVQKTGSLQIDDMTFNQALHAFAPLFAGLNEPQRYQMARCFLVELFRSYRRNKDVRAIACRTTNCFGCCLYQADIDTSPFEVERILDVVQARGDMETVVSRAESVSSAGGGACPLLSPKRRCTVYNIRPLACAAYHSLDRQACHAGPKSKITYANELMVTAGVIAALGMLPLDVIFGTGRKPKYRLFQLLAQRGRKRLEMREAS